MSKHRLEGGRGIFRRLVDAGFFAVVAMLVMLIALIIGVAVGLRLL